MYNTFLKFLSLLFLCLFLNNCSTISETLNVEEIINKTEEFFFGDEKVEESSSNKETESFTTVPSENTSEDDSYPDISEVPEVQPDFPVMDKDFFQGEESGSLTLTDGIEAENNASVEEKNQSFNDNITDIQKRTISVIKNISYSMRLKVKSMLASSDPPTKADAEKISFEEENNKYNNTTNLTKIAIIQFPNNSIIPDGSAQEVLNEIVNSYSNRKLKLIGHASRSGGQNIEGKRINMEISFARAKKIRSILIEKGFMEEQIFIEGKGDLETTSDNTDENYVAAADRRVEVFYITD
ncbi:MAG: hypothetical protein CMP24_00715 [Rickettsiales bacterium]|nr:hypothetical protein [Rickettsiales bacterium]